MAICTGKNLMKSTSGNWKHVSNFEKKDKKAGVAFINCFFFFFLESYFCILLYITCDMSNFVLPLNILNNYFMNSWALSSYKGDGNHWGTGLPGTWLSWRSSRGAVLGRRTPFPRSRCPTLSRCSSWGIPSSITRTCILCFWNSA